MSQRRATKLANRRRRRSRSRELSTSKRAALVIAEQMRLDSTLRRTYLMSRDQARDRLVARLVPEGMAPVGRVRVELEKQLRKASGK